MNVRAAERDDLEALRSLRNHYVASSYATFDEQSLTPEDMQAWFRDFAQVGPHRLLVAESSGVLAGYVASQVYRPRPAFRKTVETSIYVCPNQGGQGIGTILYTALFAAIANEGLHRAVVGIALPNDASVRLHEKLGFTEIGIFSEYAIKNDQFISSLWMEKAL